MLSVAVTGGIACGKSTVIKKLSECTFPKDISIVQCPEPLSRWTDLPSHSLLNKTYNPLKEYYDGSMGHFEFQTFVQASFLQNLKDRYAKIDKKTQIFVCERTAFDSLHIFAKTAYESDKLTDRQYTILAEQMKLYKSMDPELFSYDLICYLSVSPKVQMNRLRIRARSEEASVMMDYLKTLSRAYDSWQQQSMDSKFIKINNEGSLEDCALDIKTRICEMLNF